MSSFEGNDSDSDMLSIAGKWKQDTSGAIAILGDGHDSLSYQKLGEGVDEFGRVLRSFAASGIERVAVVIRDRWAMAYAEISLLVHAVCVPVNPEYTPEELTYYFNLLGVSSVLTLEGEQHPAGEVARLLGLCHRELIPGGGNVLFSLKEQDDRKSFREPESGHADPNKLILHTSGSTAAPKVVPLTFSNLEASIRNLQSSLQLTDQDVCLNMMPLFHVGGLIDLLLAPLLTQGQVVMVPAISTGSFFTHFHQTRPTWIQLVPVMLQDIVRQIEEGNETVDKHQLRFIRSVSSPLPQGLRERAERLFGVPVIEIYGMTETAGVITSQPLDENRRKIGSVGVAQETELAIADEVGNRVKTGQTGEVIVRGAQVMSGYEGAKNIQQEVFVAGWLRTGDLGHLDEEGNLFLTGRIKEIINRGGEKISPLEIDQVLQEFPGVVEVAAFSMPHPSLGEEVAAAVVMAAQTHAEGKEIIEFAAKKLAKFKVPKKIYFTDSLPRNRGGKLRRFELASLMNDQDQRLAGKVTASVEWTETGGRLRNIWMRSLELNEMTPEDNFFELGGDSLKAATLCAEIQKEFDVPIDVAALLDHQTLSAFERYITEQCGKQKSEATLSGSGLPDDLYEELKAFSLAWKGERRTPGSLVVGRNTLGHLPPLFWCAQSSGEVQCVADHLNNDRPIYGMRSLYRVQVRSEENNLKVSRYYADEIACIQPDGEIMLGGFCEGGKIACEIARVLEAKGRKVACLLLQEYFEPARMPCDVIYFASEKTARGPRYFFYRPEVGFPRYCEKRVAWVVSPWAHDDYYIQPFVKEGVAELERGLAGEVVWLKINKLHPPQNPEVKIKAWVPRFWFPGQRRTVEVEVVNKSVHPLLPASESGISLGYRWLDRKGRQVAAAGESLLFPKTLESGQTGRFQLNITAPTRQSKRLLEIALVEEGVRWLDEKSLKIKINILPSAHWLQKVLPLVSQSTD